MKSCFVVKNQNKRMHMNADRSKNEIILRQNLGINFFFKF